MSSQHQASWLLLENHLTAFEEKPCPLLLSFGDHQAEHVGTAGQAGDGADGSGLGSGLLAGGGEDVDDVGLLAGGGSGRNEGRRRNGRDLRQVDTAGSLDSLDLVETEDLVEELVGSRGTLGRREVIVGNLSGTANKGREGQEDTKGLVDSVLDLNDLGVVTSGFRGLLGWLRLGGRGALSRSLGARLFLGLLLGLLVGGDLERVDIVASLSNNTNARSNLHGLAAICNHDLEHDTVVLGLNIHAGLVGLDLEQHITGAERLPLLDLPRSNVTLGHGGREGRHGEVLGGEASCRGGKACIRENVLVGARQKADREATARAVALHAVEREAITLLD
ncbi:hypothetical protein HG530_002953 [Fusarium avenaceum]|nr:hypothetical protein HG530_002953 [Fusarium avenaceum]